MSIRDLFHSGLYTIEEIANMYGVTVSEATAMLNPVKIKSGFHAPHRYMDMPRDKQLALHVSNEIYERVDNAMLKSGYKIKREWLLDAIFEKLERDSNAGEAGVEPATDGLTGHCSTAELFPKDE